MVVHIVMIKFKENTSKELIKTIKNDIDALLGVVPSLKSMETGLNFSNEDRAMDLVLRAIFDDKKGLEAYAVDKAHQKVISKIKEVAEYSKVVDYETI